MDKIKTPVELTDGGASVEIRDADGNVIARCGGILDGDIYYPGGFHASQIADALNTVADQSRVIAVLTEALEFYADKVMWTCSDETAHFNNNVCIDCTKDLLVRRGFLPAEKALAEAKRIQEVK